MGRIQELTDDEIKEALIKAEGQPTIAAKSLKISYPHLYRRIRKNPELYEVQKAYRANTFQAVANVTLNAFLKGIMMEPELDEDGNVIEGKFRKTVIDPRTRLSLASNLMQTFKSDEGIKDQIEITGSGNIDISKWLTLHNSEEK